MRTKMRVGWTATIAALLTMVVPQPAQAANEYDVRYVVGPVQFDQSPLGETIQVAEFGIWRFIPEGRTVTVTIADDVHPGGSFLFDICQKNEAHPGDAYCGEGRDDVSTGDVCYQGPTTLRRIVPGNPVEVTLWWSPSPCPDAPVTGVMKIVG